MAAPTTTSIFEEIGVRPVINAVGHQTLLGGSQLSPRVRAAMEEANRYYVDMAELLERSGQIIARLLGAEAAYVTPGCAAALALGTAACIAGLDTEAMGRLPDTTGLKNEVLIQKKTRYKYDRCPTIVGARLVEVGDESGTSAAQLEAALGPRTACVLYFARMQGQPGVLPLSEVVEIAHRRGVPVLVDAAGEVFPLDYMKSWPASGADLVAYGSKYFGGPNSAGILCGRQDLIQSAAIQGFIGFESTGSRSFGRPLKLDRQEIIAVVVALQEWFGLDHEARLRGYDRMVRAIAERLQGIPAITLTPLPAGGPATRLEIAVQPRPNGRTAADVARVLRDGNPSIRLGLQGDVLSINVATVTPGDELVIAERLRGALSA
ncbi:MAG: aminotransferase class V-fold PLP-dependent enzyme [Chloroflexi bacterium]|jgi:D-glucosaminate-6-phosphate ammonia-lyase|nr:aminotransferase class V-fold PLP-dependent enzyme [Chloroflexota bacterium]